MSVKIQALIAKMAKESDPVKVSALLVEYGIAAKAEKSEDDCGDKEDGDGDEDEGKHAKAAKKAEMSKKKAEAAKHKAAGDEYRRKAAECDEKARGAMGDEDGDEDAESKAMRASLAPVASMPEPASNAAAAATAELAKITRQNTQTLAVIQADIAKREQSASIREALADGRISPHEAKMLGGKTPEWASEYIATREGVRVVNTDEGSLIVPKESGDMPSAELAEINSRIAAMGVTEPAKADKLRADMIANRRKAQTNGAGSRF